MPGDRFYSGKQWHRVRTKALMRDQYHCRFCGKDASGKGNAHVDHIVRRKEAPHLAYELSNLQTLCIRCHNQVKQRDEINPSRGSNAQGLPNDPNHPWNS